jgi:selenide,water dikinase
MGAVPHSALVIAALPFAPSEKREADLVQLLAGAQDVLDGAGCRIIGGHTGEGAELTLGFSINGFADAEQLARKDALRAGLALILTKPVGSGALFAANGRGKGKGRWISDAIRNALVSNAAAGNILREHGARAMTDVTGFGLAGHLGEMLEASDLAATLDISKVPLLEGATEVVGQGIVSTLQNANLAWQAQTEAISAVSNSEAFQLLFDPQTAGGLLAGVAVDQSEAAIAALHASGYGEARVIGETRAVDGAGLRLKVV